MQANKQFKDSVFSCYFSEDPRRLIELFNAVEGKNYPLDTKIELNTLDDVLYKDRNDLSFVLDGQLVVLVEHQSTVNENMALRMLIYLGRIYEKILSGKAMYQRSRIPIPTPKFIVLYNGTKPCPKHYKQHLSDGFILQEETPLIDLTVDVYNVNYDENLEVIQKCHSLSEYSYFIHCVREEQKNGTPFNEAVTIAIRKCIQQNIMKEFLSQHGSEVENMLTGEWNWDIALEVSKEEGFKIGQVETRTRDILSICDLLTPEQIADRFELSVDEVQDIIRNST